MYRNSLLFLAALCGSAMNLSSCAGPQRTTPGRIVDRPGLYNSPNKMVTVRIIQVAEGRLKLESTIGGPAAPFPADSGWFMCFDDKERLWTYIPRDKPAFVHCTSPAQVMAPGEFGGWDGVPNSFFERLPPEIRATRREIPRAAP